MEASRAIALQWHEGEGVHFARRVRALARHYEIFEQLPREQHGSAGNRSLLEDERVRSSILEWLTLQPIGSVTPHQLWDILNATIFPSLGIVLKCPLSERTARRWLIKLGWRLSVICKGVYMDGHKREDVVKY